MKKALLLLLTVFMMFACNQTSKTENKETEVKKAEPQKGIADEKAYAIGYDIGSNLKKSEMSLDQGSLEKGIEAGLAGKSEMTEEARKTALMEFQKEAQAKMHAKQAEQAAKNVGAAKMFLEENAKKEGVKTTASGLQYEVITMGKGKKPVASSKVKVHYKGTLLDGTEFDSSYKRNAPAEFPLGNVIKGWTEGLQLMPVGSKFKFYISPELGYGPRGAGGGQIPPNSALIFEVELLEILN